MLQLSCKYLQVSCMFFQDGFTCDMINKLPDTAKNLDSGVAEKLVDRVEKLCIAVEKLPDAVGTLGTAADKLLDKAEKLDTATGRLPKVVNQPCDVVENIVSDNFAGTYIDAFL